ncbi:MAG TPA: GH1 family beta-glucosidase [Ktedonobacteraceae bacterium]|nr:GH1 family beta-glucosidase [Ktedonobacteraceae bacterium]
MSGKLTIRQIAQLAEVSTATVSRVLNNKPDVDPLTRERVLHIIAEHGYVPDLIAAQLASRPASRNHPFRSSFPADFLWGAATSAYQIEGAAHEDGRADSIWDTFARQEGATLRGETGEVAIDHYHRMPEDVALMAELNLDAYRFSLSWSRILPQGTGPVNARGLDFYDRLVDALLERNITPVATLYHWDLPQALHERGGWLACETAYAFADYAEVVTRRLGDRVAWWITLNEPWCSAYLGYGLGAHAPGIADMQSAVVAAHHLLLAHGLALPRMRQQASQDARVGITLNITPVSAADDRAETLQGVEHMDVLYNRWFLDPLYRRQYPERLFADLAVAPPAIGNADMSLIAAPLDFVGVNYYFRLLLRARRRGNDQQGQDPAYEQVVPVPGASYTEMAWEIYPQGLGDCLLRVHREYAPPLILVTENGAAFADQWDGRNPVRDERRVQYLREHIDMLEHVRRLGVPVGGYFVWSLLDNFEWTDGYSKRFGLVYVDYSTQRRFIKESGRWYAAFIQAQRQGHAYSY